MHFVEIVASEVRLPHRRREMDSVPRQERRIHLFPGSAPIRRRGALYAGGAGDREIPLLTQGYATSRVFRPI